MNCPYTLSIIYCIIVAYEQLGLKNTIKLKRTHYIIMLKSPVQSITGLFNCKIIMKITIEEESSSWS